MTNDLNFVFKDKNPAVEESVPNVGSTSTESRKTEVEFRKKQVELEGEYSGFVPVLMKWVPRPYRLRFTLSFFQIDPLTLEIHPGVVLAFHEFRHIKYHGFIGSTRRFL